jgi:hypothetical protein
VRLRPNWGIPHVVPVLVVLVLVLVLVLVVVHVLVVVLDFFTAGDQQTEDEDDHENDWGICGQGLFPPVTRSHALPGNQHQQ